MQDNKIFENLNEKQIEAVKVINGPVLVISGPGSGKTRCLTHRIAHLIDQGIRPENILALSFTNKAAREMGERVTKLLDNGIYESRKPLMGTFHSVCVRILRREIHALGYGNNFVIYDTDDQVSLIKKIMSDLEIDTKRFYPRAILGNISKLKTELTPPNKYKPADFFPKIVSSVYNRYQSELKKANALDFDDLIGFTVKLFTDHPEILHRYQEWWKYILIDEYQDTSHDQYVLIRLLSGKYKNLFCIGDDAQGIYTFRQADIRNILNFQKDYPDAKIILLEQNYRSTKNIITAAQGLISNNKSQIRKELWTENSDGEKISINESLNEKREGMLVISKIENYMKKGYKPKDFAVLYRTHAQSRAIEEALIMKGFPYQIVGGIKFYERKEVKDILAYLKVLHNPADLISFGRIYNIPPRGLGRTALSRILSIEENDLIKAVGELSKDNPKLKQSQHLADFHKLLSGLKKLTDSKKLSVLIGNIVRKTDYEEYLKSYSSGKVSDHENFNERMENIRELLTVAKKYDHLPGKEGLAQFLEEVALLQESDRVNIKGKRQVSKNFQETITLMTTHASKGLEFPVVFIVGMEEGIFPHSRVLINPSELEEERRLCYVAITRAKEHLIITHTKYRSIYGRTESNLPSRFLRNEKLYNKAN